MNDIDIIEKYYLGKPLTEAEEVWLHEFRKKSKEHLSELRAKTMAKMAQEGSLKSIEETSSIETKSLTTEPIPVVPMIPIQGGKHPDNRPKLWKLKQVAAILLLVSGSWWGIREYRASQTPQYEQLIASYLEEIPAFANTKMGDPTPEDLEKQAKTAYSQKQYEQSAQLLFQITQTNEATVEHHYFLAQCLMHQTQPDYGQAINHLLKARELGHSQKDFDINWYLGLAYIKTKDFDKAKIELEKNRGKNRSTEIQKLLDNMPK